MKITNFKKSAIGTTQRAESSSSAKTVKEAGSEASAVRKAGVSLSANEEIASTLSQDSAKRADKVSSLKMEVSSGQYQTNSAKTAEGIMKDVTGYSLA